MRTALLIFFLSLSFIVSAQSSDPPKITKYVTQLPKFDGDLGSYLNENLHYPKKARDSGYSGKVFIKFVVDKKGRVRDATIIKGFNEYCDEEALRVIKEMPRWIPGRTNGKAVKTYFTLPIQFKIE